MKKLLFVYNPLSGKGKIEANLPAILGIMSGAGYEVTAHTTRRRDDAYEFIKAYGNEFDRIVVSGGDGTLNESVRGILDGRINSPIGYIPAGTTNDFAHSFEIPRDMEEAAKVAAYGMEYPCDVGLMNGQPFIYVSCFGTLSDISYVTSQRTKSIMGHGAYVFEGFKRYHGLDSIHVRVESAELVADDIFCYGMIGNSRYTAGVKLNYAKDVKLNDGRFEVTLIKKPKNLLQFMATFFEFLNVMKTKKQIYKFTTSKITLCFDEPEKWTRDGEFGGENMAVTIEVLKTPIRILVPQDAKI